MGLKKTNLYSDQEKVQKRYIAASSDKRIVYENDFVLPSLWQAPKKIQKKLVTS